MILQYHFLTKTSQKTTRAFTVIYPKWIEDLGFLIDEMIWSIAVIKSLSCLKIRLRWFAIDARFFFAMAGVDWRYKLVQHHQHLVTYFASFSQQNRGHVMWKLFCLRCSVGFLTIFDLSWCYWAKQEQPRPSEYRHARATATWLETYSKLGSQRTNCSHDVMSIAIIIVNLILNQN